MKVGFTGAHGVGKTTLCQQLLSGPLADKNYHFVTGVGGRCPYPINEQGTAQSQAWIIMEQIKAEATAAQSGNVLTDRSMFDHMAYTAEMFFEDRVSKDFWDLYKQLAYAWLNTYDVIFYVPRSDKIPLVADGKRSTDVHFQERIDADIYSAVVRSDADTNIVMLDEDPDGRMEAVLAEIETLPLCSR